MYIFYNRNFVSKDFIPFLCGSNKSNWENLFTLYTNGAIQKLFMNNNEKDKLMTLIDSNLNVMALDTEFSIHEEDGRVKFKTSYIVKDGKDSKNELPEQILQLFAENIQAKFCG